MSTPVRLYSRTLECQVAIDLGLTLVRDKRGPNSPRGGIDSEGEGIIAELLSGLRDLEEPGEDGASALFACPACGADDEPYGSVLGDLGVFVERNEAAAGSLVLRVTCQACEAETDIEFRPARVL